MRSKLFVPGSRPELFAKALDSQADAIHHSWKFIMAVLNVTH